MDTDHAIAQHGWAVYDTNDEKIGDVVGTGPGWLLLRTGARSTRDLYVPADAIAETDEARGRVYLQVAAADIDRMGWADPPTSGTPAATGPGTTSPGRGTTPPGPTGTSGHTGTPDDTGVEAEVTAADRAGTAGGNLSGDVMEEADARVTGRP